VGINTKTVENQSVSEKSHTNSTWDSIFNSPDMAPKNFVLDDEDREWLSQKSIGRESCE
jgi:hypothetical protein